MKKRIMLSLTFLIAFSFSSAYATTEHQEPVKVAIIIDDFGGKVKGVDSFFDSKIPITVAIMPFLEKSKEQAKLAHEHGLEVMIHLPLEPKKGKKSWLGPNPITSDLSIEEVKKRVQLAIDEVPYAVGLNNHMGSKIVEDEKMVRAILEVVKENNFYVIDSGTSNKSMIPKVAEELDIPWAIRDTFLDDTLSSRQHVAKQMKKLSKVASKKGKAIGIGHVGIKGEETVLGIQSMIEEFSKQNIEIVPASHILETPIEKNPQDFWKPGTKE
ncbi:divergent polysaccharide deacetylase family protein [Bacillus alkalicellulosilyticus]|uniref:divergent polysaccharide deacetylase family protein n=1 Tax=Alkalihalobacterium alkalicellulosilyticum TaxID=1912214 RepID=UPI00099806C6|nr:divergent polysaccharide deacetylase family protein [Bacillus alkalicellulosilyticus]